MVCFCSRPRTPASQGEDELDLTTTPGSAKSNTRRKANSDGLLLTKSGRVSMINNQVNAKFDASYRNSENTNKLLGRSLSLGQACGLIGVALYGSDIPLEDSGNFFNHILHIQHIVHIQNITIYIDYIPPLTGHSDRIIVLKSAAYYALIDEELEEILSCDNEPVLKAYVVGLFRAASRLWKFVMPVEAKAIFQNDVFHPATVDPKLQAHLGLSLEKRIFDKYVDFIFEYVSYSTYLTYFAYFAYSVGLARVTSISALHRFPRPRRMLLNEVLKGL